MRALFLAAIAAAIAFVIVAWPRETQPHPIDKVAPDVKVLLDSGHGSAVHIGNGYFLTASHVVATDPDRRVVLKFDDLSIGRARVLWFNPEYDVALLKLDIHDRVEAAPLSCRTPARGERVTAKGNPGFLEFVDTTGTVAGDVRKIAIWERAIAVAMAVVPGMSGGGVYDASGEVVGINVGATLVPIGYAGVSLSGIGVIVPGSVICDLMGRQA